MSGYSDGWNEHVSRATATVHTDTPEAKKPNPIGFHARLPGDAPKRKL